MREFMNILSAPKCVATRQNTAFKSFERQNSHT